MTAVREAVLNALIHRDYSSHTEGMPIQLIIFEDRMEIRSPGSLYGRLSIDQLGKVQPDTRNPVLAVAMEILNQTENRYSGIPTIFRELAAANMPEPEFINRKGSFSVCFRLQNSVKPNWQVIPVKESSLEERLLVFCETPKTRQEIADFLYIKTINYVMKNYVTPMVNKGLLALKYPEKPRSSKQEYTSTKK